MRSRSVFSLLVGVLLLAATGCAHHYYPPPPPQAYQAIPPLIQVANRLGFEAGQQDASRDLYQQTGYHPRRDGRFHDTPGYDPRLGPYPPFREAYRQAYLHGYDTVFRR